MTKRIGRLLGLTLALCLLASCSGRKSSDFIAEGTISGAADQMLYLEETISEEPRLIDSVRLDKQGHFSFRSEGHSYPMLYRLRLGEQHIPFAADSARRFSITAEGARLFDSYRITSPEDYNKQIQEVCRLSTATSRQLEPIVQEAWANRLNADSARARSSELIAALKKQLTERFIYADPKSPAACFALLQTIGSGSYFSPLNPDDAPAFAAVATAYDTFYPEAPYAALLKKAALQARAIKRGSCVIDEPDYELPQQPEVVAYPELSYPDRTGRKVSLKELAAQGPTLVSFTSYAEPWSPELVAELRQLQQAHPELRIYEVSVDADSYFWKNATRTLPWTTVHDAEGRSLGLYNVQRLPSFYAIRGGDLQRLSSPSAFYR